MGFLAQATGGIYLVYGFRGVVLPACVEPFIFSSSSSSCK